MATTRTLVSIVTAAVTISSGGTYYILNKPTGYVTGEIRISATPDDAGYLNGMIIAVSGTLKAFDAGPGDAADAQLDAAPRPDAALDATAPAPDAAQADAAQVDAAPDAGFLGRYEPAYSPAPNSLPVADSVNTLPLAKPAVGAWVTDPNFGARIRRLQADGYHDYSQLYAESWDASKLLLVVPGPNGGQYRTLNASTLAQVSAPTEAWEAPRWLPNGDILFITGQPLRLMSQTPGSASVTELLRFSFLPFGKTSMVFEKLSDSGQWTAAVGYQPGDVSRVVLAVDLVNKRVGAQISVDNLFASGGPCVGDEWGPQININWVRPSPSGRWLIVQWDRSGETRCSGAEMFDIETGAFVRRLHDHGVHGDFGVLNGREFYLTNFSASPWNNNFPAIGLEWLDGVGYTADAKGATTKRADTALRMVEWGTFLHASCGRGGPWLCLISSQPGTGGLKGELYLINESGALLRIAKHRSTACSYWEQPRASTFRESGKNTAIFDSDWGTCGQPAPYEIRF